jgi:hypothetical protein
MFWIGRSIIRSASRRKPSGRRPGVYPKGAGYFFAFFVLCVIVGACAGH